ncbi:partial Heme/hemopexin-binding protein, partial [Geobacteraceae bacterium]
MNKIYRMIWSKAKEQWVVVSEKVSAKGAIPSVTVGALTVAALLAAGGGAFALDPGALPTGGRITAGNATIATSGNQMTINQSSQQMIANWNSFNIGQNAGVSFNQPNSGATALNRIQDQNPTQILGSLSANGRIFLLNPAGIIFGQNAKVDVGGLVASSLNMLDSDFLAGRYTFSGPGNAGSIINQGNLSANGGIVALIAPKVSNEGTITATNGSAALIAGNQVSVDFQGDGLITYTVDQGAVDALAENKGLIKADGGLVVLTAKAANALTNAVVNNSGVIEAQTLVNKGGRILLLSDMQSGATSVSGTLDASAPDGGDGGFVETSGGRVKIGSGTVITTRAPSGTSGTWLIDPDGYTIAASGGDIDGTTLGNNVDNNGDTIISSTDGSGSDGNINVNDNVTWHANNLALIATNDININAVMTTGAVDDTGDPGTFASLDLEPGSGTVNVGFNPDGTFKGKVDFFQADGVTPRSGAGFLTINGNPYTVITDLGLAGDESTGDSTLQGMAYGGNSSGYFALGSNIDATDTSGWNYGEGFVPIGTGGYSFTGTFDGLGHTISNLSINRNANEQGLFGVTDGATLRNVGLTDVNVTGYGNVGALVGYGYGTAIMNSSVIGSVTAGDYSTGVGGLMGYDYGGSSIINSHASATVTAGVNSTGVGGLMGYGYGSSSGSTILNSHATGNVTGGNSVGGLVGYGYDDSITNSYATGEVTGTGDNVGGLVGYTNGSNPIIDNSYATGPVTGNNYVGGLVGSINSSNITISNNSHADGLVTGNSYVGGLVGSVNSGGTINISDAYAIGGVKADINPNGQYIGGLVGYLYGGGYGYGSGSEITNSHASGIVTAGDSSSNVGGLIGYNENVAITDSDASGAVTAGAYGDSVGGLVGNNSNGAITSSHATGKVTVGAYSSNVGGLVGNNADSAIDGSYATGEVAADAATGQYVGGLVGYNNSNSGIDNSYATGPVTGNSYVGGLVGYDSGNTITNSYATGAVHAGDDSSNVGGLVGYGYEVSITNSHADGPVTAGANGNNIGGLVGDFESWGYGSSSISDAYATGAVTGGADSSNIGGLVGNSYSYGYGNTITNSFATGAVTADATASQNVGGLVGTNNSNSSIENSYATGPVTGNSYVGGLVGYDNGNGITNSFATGPVTGGSYAGGLVGDSGSSVITSSFWDKTVNSDPALDNGFGTGKTTTELKTLATFTDAGWDIDDAGGTGSVWRIYDGNTMPLLRGFLTPLTSIASPVTKTYDGTAYTGDLDATYSDPTAPASGHLQGLTSPYASFVNAGTYSPSPAYSDQLGYDITASGDSSLTITPAALSITAGDASKSYGQTPTLSAFTSSGLQNGETIGSVTLASAGTAATAGVSGSPYAIAASNATGGSFSLANYTITYNNGALTITPAALSITASDASKSYGQTTTFTGTEFTSSGLQNSETIGSVTLSSAGTAATAGVSGSPYTIAASNATGGTFSAGNYTITYNNGALTVTPAALSITAGDASKSYGQTPTLSAFTSSGLQNGE